jgi:hypothetical protein
VNEAPAAKAKIPRSVRKRTAPRFGGAFYWRQFRGINIERLRDAPAEWIAFDALLFCCGDILRKGVELTFRCGAMHGEDVEERR